MGGNHHVCLRWRIKPLQTFFFHQVAAIVATSHGHICYSKLIHCQLFKKVINSFVSGGIMGKNGWKKNSMMSKLFTHHTILWGIELDNCLEESKPHKVQTKNLKRKYKLLERLSGLGSTHSRRISWQFRCWTVYKCTISLPLVPGFTYSLSNWKSQRNLSY